MPVSSFKDSVPKKQMFSDAKSQPLFFRQEYNGLHPFSFHKEDPLYHWFIVQTWSVPVLHKRTKSFSSIYNLFIKQLWIWTLYMLSNKIYNHHTLSSLIVQEKTRQRVVAEGMKCARTSVTWPPKWV